MSRDRCELSRELRYCRGREKSEVGGTERGGVWCYAGLAMAIACSRVSVMSWLSWA